MLPFLSHRTFQIKGPFGLQLTLRTKVPGTLSVAYPHTNTVATFATQSSTAQMPVELYNDISVDIQPLSVSVFLPFHIGGMLNI
jgi:hypothetical protein